MNWARHVARMCLKNMHIIFFVETLQKEETKWETYVHLGEQSRNNRKIKITVIVRDWLRTVASGNIV